MSHAASPRGHRHLWPMPAIAALLTLLVGGYATERAFLADSVQPTGTALPDARLAPRAGEVYLGVSTHGVGAGVDGWDQAAGISQHPALYGRWTTPNGPFAPILADTASRPGITPIVHWNLPFANGRVTDGSQDTYILAQVAAVKAYRNPVFVRLDWEMNTDFYPGWNAPGVSPGQYVASWRHVVKLFAGVPNVAFVWSPNVFTSGNHQVSEWYPGDAYVDWTGLDAYPQSAPSSALLNGPGAMDASASFAAQHRKPLMLAEWALNTPHPDGADPINMVFDWAARYPAVRALVYFDFNLPPKDFRLASHPIAAAAFRKRTVGHPNFLLTVPGSTSPAGTASPSGSRPPTSTPSAAPSTGPTDSPSPWGNTGLGSPTHLYGIQSYTSVMLHWRPVSGASGYEVYRGGVPVAQTPSISYNDTGLTSGTPYTWTVAALDIRSVPGAISEPFTITPGRWGTHDQPCTYGPGHRPCRYPSEGSPPVP